MKGDEREIRRRWRIPDYALESEFVQDLRDTVPV
jgi:hypothetical protein